MIEEAVAEKLAGMRDWLVEHHLIEREAALEAFIVADRQRIIDGRADANSRYPGFSGGLAPYLANQNADLRMPFVRLPSAAKRLRIHTERAVVDAFKQVTRKAGSIEDTINVAKCAAVASIDRGFGILAQIEPAGGGHFEVWISLRFQYGVRNGIWRPMVIMTMSNAELPDGSRPRSLVGPRILRAFADLQNPKPVPPTEPVVDEKTTSGL